MHAALTKAQLRTLLGVDNDAEVADFFGITQSAVSQWGDDDAEIPRGRRLDLMEKRPDLVPVLLGQASPGHQGAL